MNPGGQRGVLGFRDFRLLLAGLLTGWLVLPVQFVAQIFWVQEHGPEEFRILLVGMIGTLRGAGTLSVGLYAGALADRYDRRAVLIVTQSLTAALHGGIAIVMAMGEGPGAFLAFYALVMLSAATWAVDLPVRQAIVPDVVGARLAPAGIALSTAAIHLVEPPALLSAGFLVEALGFAWCYALTALGNLAAVLTLLPVRYRTGWGPERASGFGLGRTAADIRLALGYSRRHATVLWILVLSTTVMVLGYPAVANLGPTWITTVLEQSVRRFGFIATAWTLAAFAVSIILTRYAHVERKGRLLAVSALLFAVSFGVFAVPAVPFAVIGNIGLGGSLAAMRITSASIIQHLVPNEVRARLMSLLAFTLGLAQLATLPVALAGQLLSLQVLFPILAAVSMLAVAAVVLLRPAIRRVWITEAGGEVAGPAAT